MRAVDDLAPETNRNLVRTADDQLLRSECFEFLDLDAHDLEKTRRKERIESAGADTDVAEEIDLVRRPAVPVRLG